MYIRLHEIKLAHKQSVTWLAHRQSVTTPQTAFAAHSKQSPIVLRQFWDSPGLAIIHSTTRASDGTPQENHGNMLQHASTCFNGWHRRSCMAHVKLHFAKRASASGTPLFPDLSIVTIQLSQFNCHNSIGGRPRGVRISSWPSCASHLSVQTPATTIRHQAETVGAEVHLRHAGSPTNRPVRQRIDKSSSHTRMKRLRSSYENQSQHLSVCMRT